MSLFTHCFLVGFTDGRTFFAAAVAFARASRIRCEVLRFFNTDSGTVGSFLPGLPTSGSFLNKENPKKRCQQTMISRGKTDCSSYTRFCFHVRCCCAHVQHKSRAQQPRNLASQSLDVHGHDV